MAERRPASAEPREAAERERQEAAPAAQPVPHSARGVGNAALARHPAALAATAGLSNSGLALLARDPNKNFSSPDDAPSAITLPEITVEGDQTGVRGRRLKEAEDKVKDALDLYAGGFLATKTNVVGACSLFGKMLDTASAAEAAVDVQNVVAKGWEKAWAKVVDAVVEGVSAEVPLAKATLEAGRLVIDELDRANKDQAALNNLLIIEDFQRKASNRLDILFKQHTKTDDNVFQIMDKLPDPASEGKPDDGSAAVEAAKAIKQKADEAVKKMPGQDQILSDLAAAWLTATHSVTERFLSKSTTGQLFVQIGLNKKLEMQSKTATLAVPGATKPGADRVSSALFGAGEIDVLQLPVFRRVTLTITELDDQGGELTLDRRLTYELGPDARKLSDGSTKHGIDAGVSGLTQFQPPSIPLKRGEVQMVPSVSEDLGAK